MAARELIESLRLMLRLYRQLIELGKQKKDQVIGNRLNDLTETLAKESRVLKQLTEADKARVRAVLAFQRSLGLKEDPEAKLHDLANLILNRTEKSETLQLLEDIGQAAAELKELNERNQALVRQALEMVEFTLDLLAGPPLEEPVYQAPTRKPAEPKRISRFDAKA